MSEASDMEARDAPRLFLRAEAAFGAVAMAFNAVGTLLIVAVMILVNADVIGRAGFNAPLAGVPEMVSLSIVAIVFLQVAQSMRARRLIRSEAIPNLLPARAALCAVYDLAAVALIFVLARASWPLFVKAWDRNTFVGAVGDFTAPVWPVTFIIVIGCAALLAQLLLSAMRHVMVAAGRIR